MAVLKGMKGTTDERKRRREESRKTAVGMRYEIRLDWADFEIRRTGGDIEFWAYGLIKLRLRPDKKRRTSAAKQDSIAG